MRNLHGIVLLLWAAVLPIGCASAQSKEATAGERTPAPWPHIRLDREAGVVELDARVVIDKDNEWLELIVCTVGGREYESVLATEARPSHLHLALLTLGLEPGRPLSWQRNDQDELVMIEPAGPPVEVTLVYEADGQRREVDPSAWIRNAQTGEPMPADQWLFTGSAFVDYEGKKVYMADLNGTILSLVNFGDDLIARNTQLTNQTDGGEWVANHDAIPAKDTAVIVRIKPAKPAAADPFSGP